LGLGMTADLSASELGPLWVEEVQYLVDELEQVLRMEIRKCISR
jgi:hypothetical protein